MLINRQNLPVLISYLIIAVLFFLTINNCFFWDTIQLGSKQANFYFTTNFTVILLPNSIDSGHIPAFGMYLALIWKIFGRSLIVSHLAMLPFVLGIIWQLQKLIAKFVKKEYAGWAFLLVFLDPTLLSQLTLISPDVPLVFFFLAGLNSTIENKEKALSISIGFLFLTSMRGMMVSFCLMIIDFNRNITYSNSLNNTLLILIRRSLIYIPAFIIFLSYSTYHYLEKGWIGFHDNSPWAELFEGVGFKGLIFNIGILGWRIVDFGRIGIWIVFFVLVLKYRNVILKERTTRFLFWVFIILLVFLSANMVWAKNLLGHRYLLPIYLSFSLLCAHILFSYHLNRMLKIALTFIWMASITTGNLWIYPEKISQGWDSTLGHLPYYKIRNLAIEYVDKQGIDFREIQSFFPNNSKIDDTDLNQDNRQFVDFDNSCEYVLYSNVFNVSDEEYYLVRNQYEVIKRFKRGLLYFDICKKSSTLK